LQILLEVRCDVVELCHIKHSHISVVIWQIVEVQIGYICYQITPLENYASR